MPNTTVAFAPDINERQLDRETEQINERLQQVGQNVPVSFDPQGMDGLTPAGMDGGGIGGDGGGLGGTGAAAGLASRIPKPVAGVAFGAAVPVALGGAIGAGMLSAMYNNSARLQTSASILQMAWSSVWRVIGNKVDQLFIRDQVMKMADHLFDLSSAIQNGQLFKGINAFGKILNTSLDWSQYINPVMWPNLLGRKLGERLASFIQSQWPNLSNFVSGVDLSKWVTGVNLGNFIQLPGWLTPGGKQPGGEPPSPGPAPGPGPGPTGGGGGGGGGNRPGGGSGGGGGGGDGFERREPSPGPGGPPVFSSGGSSGADATAVTDKLDEVNRNLKRLSKEMANQAIVVDGEAIGRVAQENQRDRINDTDPLA